MKNNAKIGLLIGLASLILGFTLLLSRFILLFLKVPLYLIYFKEIWIFIHGILSIFSLLGFGFYCCQKNPKSINQFILFFGIMVNLGALQFSITLDYAINHGIAQ